VLTFARGGDYNPLTNEGGAPLAARDCCPWIGFGLLLDGGSIEISWKFAFADLTVLLIGLSGFGWRRGRVVAFGGGSSVFWQLHNGKEKRGRRVLADWPEGWFDKRHGGHVLTRDTFVSLWKRKVLVDSDVTVSHRSFSQHESLILAQNERWRQA
jgi:hypothetical protein